MPFFVSVYQMVLPVIEAADIWLQLTTHLSTPKDERLSWPGWLTCSGWLTHMSGHSSAIGRAQGRESSPAKDRRSTAELRNQPACCSDDTHIVTGASNIPTRHTQLAVCMVQSFISSKNKKLRSPWAEAEIDTLHTHNRFTVHIPGLPGWAGARRKLSLLLDFIVQDSARKDNRGRHTDNQLGATPSGLISDHLNHPHFTPRGCPSCRNIPNLSWLGTGTKYAGLHTQWLDWEIDTIIQTKLSFAESLGLVCLV